MRITELRADGTGVADLAGSRCDVDLALVPDAGVGSYVLVHAGFAIEILDEQAADAALALFAELAATLTEAPTREVR
jgi:hydrogenase expression/formation protein HypC